MVSEIFSKIFAPNPTRKFRAETSSMGDILDYADGFMQSFMVDKYLRLEYRLVLEEILLKLFDKAARDTDVTVELVRGFGSRFSLRFKCRGDLAIMDLENRYDVSGKIIHEYLDYLKQDYVAGYNSVEISFSFGNFIKYGHLFFAGLAILVIIAMYVFCTGEQLLNNTKAILQFYIGGLQTIAAPCLCFALANSIIKLHQDSQYDWQLSKLLPRYLTTSLIASCVGYSSFLLPLLFPRINSLDYLKMDVIVPNTFSEYVQMFTFANVVDVFTISFPLPLLLLSAMIGMSACNVLGPEGAFLRKCLAALNCLFSNMLVAIYDVLLFFAVIAFFSNCIDDGFIYTVICLAEYAALFFLQMSILLFLYALSFRLDGISFVGFLRDYKEILQRNFFIGSNIDALPYNQRMLPKKLTHLPPDKLKGILAIGASVNMTGNCLIISSFTALAMVVCGISPTTPLVLNLLIITILLSIGTPNQPASFLLSVIFLFGFLGISPEFYSTVLILEILLSVFYSFINCLDDIVIALFLDKNKERQLKTLKKNDGQ